MSRGPQSALSYDTRTPNLKDVVEAHGRALNLELSVSFPATVSEVQRNGETVKVVPDFKDVVWTETGEQTQPSYELTDIPVWTYGQGAVGGGYLQFPVRVGDKGLIIVSDRSLDGWYESGLPNAPSHYHTHSRIDGVFMPGLRDRSRELAQETLFPNTAVLESIFIKLGASASQAAVLGNALDTYIKTTIVLIFNTHVHTLTPGGTSPPVTPMTNPSGILSTKVKIE